MPSFKSILSASAMAFFASTSAHMVMNSPPPYGSPNNSPLDASGSDFPCKTTSNAGGPVTNMAIGEQQTLQFKGQAVHGGGSCQVSLTTDNPATKNSKWQVIHSIEGGCPARNQAGNAGESPDPIDPDTYKYSIPTGINPGKYTLAWTWFNKVGNREMYMNCANIMVTSGTGKRDVLLNETEQYAAIPELSERDTPSFPAMFTANIGNGCATGEGPSLAFPNPGSSVEKNENQLAPPVGSSCGSAAGGSSSTGASTSGGSSGSSAPAGASSGSGSGSAAAAAVPSSAAGSASSSGSSGASSGGVDSQAAPGAASSPSSPAPAAPAASAAAPPAQGNSSGSASAAPAAGGSSSSGSSGGSAGGSLLCSPDGKQFAVSGGGSPQYQPVAQGTACKGGAITFGKRSARYNSRYVRRNFPDLMDN